MGFFFRRSTILCRYLSHEEMGGDIDFSGEYFCAASSKRSPSVLLFPPTHALTTNLDRAIFSVSSSDPLYEPHPDPPTSSSSFHRRSTGRLLKLGPPSVSLFAHSPAPSLAALKLVRFLGPDSE